MKPSEYGLNRCLRKAIAIPASVAGIAMESPIFSFKIPTSGNPRGSAGGWQSQTLKDRFTDIIHQKQNPLRYRGAGCILELYISSSRLDRQGIIHRK